MSTQQQLVQEAVSELLLQAASSAPPAAKFVFVDACLGGRKSAGQQVTKVPHVLLRPKELPVSSSTADRVQGRKASTALPGKCSQPEAFRVLIESYSTSTCRSQQSVLTSGIQALEGPKQECASRSVYQHDCFESPTHPHCKKVRYV